MTNLTYLPCEILNLILQDKNISFSEILKFGATCKQFYDIANNNKLWQKKFFKRWPNLKEVYNKCIDDVEFKKEVKASIKCRQELMLQLSLMHGKHYYKDDLSIADLRDYELLFHVDKGAHPRNYHFLVDELTSLLKHRAEHQNLTYRYYAMKILRYLKHHNLKTEWQRITNLSSTKQTLEEAATFVAQWSQPEKSISYSHIATILDNIAEQALERLREEHPLHPVFEATIEQLFFWKHNNINDNQWSGTQAKQVINVLCKLIFQELGFHGSSETLFNPESAFIDCVLEKKEGIALSLAIIFESVARRLGILCEIIALPSHLFLGWKKSYNPENCEGYSYIDVFNNGQILDKRDCPRIGEARQCPIKDYTRVKIGIVEVVLKLINTYQLAIGQQPGFNDRGARIRSALELRYLMEPTNLETLLHLGRHFLVYRINISDIILISQNISQRQWIDISNYIRHVSTILTKCEPHLQPEKKRRLMKRTSEVKFAIGLVMLYTKDYEHYLCVITGWDIQYQEPIPTFWQEDNQILEDGENQPFYKILVEDGTMYYAAQEKLEVTKSVGLVGHSEIGRYFCKFDKTHYVPNESLANEYPEDADVRDKYIALYGLYSL